MTPISHKKPAALLLAFLLASCGGGGGNTTTGGGGATPPPAQSNTPPTITNFTLGGESGVHANDTLSASYLWSDADNDLEGNSTFVWFRNGEVIEGANSSSYTVSTNDRSKEISVQYTPIPATGSAIRVTQSDSVFVLATSARVSTLANTGFGRGDGMVTTADGDLLVSGGRNSDKIVRITKTGEVSDFDSGDLNSPAGMGFDSNGNLYVINALSNSIHKITPEGLITEFASGLDGPAGLAVSDNDYIYVTLYGADLSGTGGTVLKFQTDGSQETLANGSGMADLVGITVDEDNTVYVANKSNGRVFKIASGNVSNLAEIADTDINQIVYANDHIYIPGGEHGIIYRVSKTGEIEAYAGNDVNEIIDGDILDANFSAPNSVAISNNGKTLYTLEENGDVRLIAASTNVTSPYDSGLENSNRIAVSETGDIYVASTQTGSNNDGKIVRINKNGQVSNFISAGLGTPSDLSFDAIGNLYVADYANNSIQKITADGTITEFASGLEGPTGLTVNAEEIFVTQRDTETPEIDSVLKFQLDGSMETVNAISSMTDLGGICADNESNLYVINQSSSTLFKISNSNALLFAQLPDSNVNQLTYKNGYIYAASSNPSVIYKISKSGKVNVFVGSTENESVDGDINNADFIAPLAIAKSPHNESLYVLESGGNIREISGASPLEISEGINGVFWEETSENIELSLNVRGEGELNYRWYQEGESEVISTEPVLSLPYSRDASGTFWAVVSDDISEVTSDKEELIVKYMPEINAQPQAATFTEGEVGTLSVEAEGINLSYEWMHEDHPQGADSPTVEFTFGGNYFVTVTSRLANGDVFTIKSATVFIRFR